MKHTLFREFITVLEDTQGHQTEAQWRAECKKKDPMCKFVKNDKYKVSMCYGSKKVQGHPELIGSYDHEKNNPQMYDKVEEAQQALEFLDPELLLEEYRLTDLFLDAQKKVTAVINKTKRIIYLPKDENKSKVQELIDKIKSVLKANPVRALSMLQQNFVPEA